MSHHDDALASAFDGQAARFERAPVQSDPERLKLLIRAADFYPDSLVLDAGCGPGLVSGALLDAGHRVVGVDLSAEMIARARSRCAAHEDRARFQQGSLFDVELTGPFDASISRYVLHHVTDPEAFIRRQIDLLRPGGVLVVSDHTTDPDFGRAERHQEFERARDTTHTRNFPPGAIVDLLARLGLGSIGLTEVAFTLDFDEWFDRGTPAEPKEAVRSRLRSAPPMRGFQPVPLDDGSVRIDCWQAIVRAVKAG